MIDKKLLQDKMVRRAQVEGEIEALMHERSELDIEIETILNGKEPSVIRLPVTALDDYMEDFSREPQ